ncbi:hypothetical protein SAMN05216524_106540 [Mucilaginibacter sp. OK098]|nr:hypothetical protein SAMN05216524_106540 [Mucilaginibacter sp. OK098]
MKYFLVLILVTSLHCFGQDYKAQIAAYRQQYMDDFLTDKSSPLKKRIYKTCVFTMPIALTGFLLKWKF